MRQARENEDTHLQFDQDTRIPSAPPLYTPTHQRSMARWIWSYGVAWSRSSPIFAGAYPRAYLTTPILQLHRFPHTQRVYRHRHSPHLHRIYTAFTPHLHRIYLRFRRLYLPSTHTSSRTHSQLSQGKRIRLQRSPTSPR